MLYREGFIIPHTAPRIAAWAGSGNWILGQRHIIAKRFVEFDAIEQQMSRRPLLLIGVGSIVTSNPIQQNIRTCAKNYVANKLFQPTVFRFAKTGESPIEFVVDFALDSFVPATFIGALASLVQDRGKNLFKSEQ